MEYLMSLTSIQFIGLFVVIANSGAGLHILLPHFPGTPYADHTSVIQYNPDQVSSVTWPKVTACGPNDSLRCAPIAVETITFLGATDPPPKDIIGEIPHLRCCCDSMTDILAKYKDPTASGKLSAHLFITQGVAEAITGGNGRTDTWVTMHSVDPTGITVNATDGTSKFSIVFKPGAQFEILNSVPDSPTSQHFVAYYLMGVGSSSCAAVPSNGPPCAPRATECPVLKVAAKKSTSITARSRAVKPKAITRLTPKPDSFDSDCSNTHWP
jgi:hypothetical protein